MATCSLMPPLLWVMLSCVASIDRHWLSMSNIEETENPANDILSLAMEIRRYCSPHFGLTDSQIKLCRQNPSHIRVLVKAAKLALKECRRIFANDRWQCIPAGNSSVGIQSEGNSGGDSSDSLPSQDSLLFSYVLSYANRETAFLHALSAAALHHQLAEDCKRGKLPRDCGCSLGPPPDYVEKWTWRGCGDNLEYGQHFSRRFTDGGQDMIARHNSAVGINTVRGMARIECTCYGGGEDCGAKTCWQKLCPFGLVADHVRELYNSAIQVVATEGELRPQFPTDGLGPESLVYAVGSPNYCGRSERYGIAGTGGRECNPGNESRHQLAGCDELCCGRGVVRKKLVSVENCNCRFVWCCRVECDTCERTKVVYYCT